MSMSLIDWVTANTTIETKSYTPEYISSVMCGQADETPEEMWEKINEMGGYDAVALGRE